MVGLSVGCSAAQSVSCLDGRSFGWMFVRMVIHSDGGLVGQKMLKLKTDLFKQI